MRQAAREISLLIARLDDPTQTRQTHKSGTKMMTQAKFEASAVYICLKNGFRHANIMSTKNLISQTSTKPFKYTFGGAILLRFYSTYIFKENKENC